MSNSWIRLWKGMENDPKWRTISRISGRSISEVMAVYLHMLLSAQKGHVTPCNANVTHVTTCNIDVTDMKRGVVTRWSDRDVGSALDLKTDDVKSIREAMQGIVLEGNLLTGWENRQPVREDRNDNSSDRVSAYREREKIKRKNETVCNVTVTPCNANVTHVTPPDTDTDTDTDKKGVEILPPIPPSDNELKEKNKKKEIPEKIKKPLIPLPWETIPLELEEWTRANTDWDTEQIADCYTDFHGYWTSQKPVVKRADWTATWRNRVREKSNKKWVKNDRNTGPGGVNKSPEDTGIADSKTPAKPYRAQKISIAEATKNALDANRNGLL